jgi:hypothetical protein
MTCEATSVAPNIDLSNLGIYNVKFFGAVGDGVTDDTIPIQLAVNAAYEAGHLRDVADLHTAKLGFPSIKGRGADAVSPADLLGRFAGFVLFENADDLRFAESGFLHDGLL